MEDSAEKTTKLLAQTPRVSHYPFCLPSCYSFVEALMAIFKFLGFKMDTQHTDEDENPSSTTRNADGKPHSPISPPPEGTYTGGLDDPAPPTEGDSSEPIASSFSRRARRPPRSRGGGGQTN